MKILCFGAGAIGSYIAGSLALIGNPLIYVEQPRFLSSLKENGVRIEDISGEKHHLKRCDAYGSAEEAFSPGRFTDQHFQENRKRKTDQQGPESIGKSILQCLQKIVLSGHAGKIVQADKPDQLHVSGLVQAHPDAFKQGFPYKECH